MGNNHVSEARLELPPLLDTPFARRHCLDDGNADFQFFSGIY